MPSRNLFNFSFNQEETIVNEYLSRMDSNTAAKVGPIPFYLVVLKTFFAQAFMDSNLNDEQAQKIRSFAMGYGKNSDRHISNRMKHKGFNDTIGYARLLKVTSLPFFIVKVVSFSLNYLIDKVDALATNNNQEPSLLAKIAKTMIGLPFFILEAATYPLAKVGDYVERAVTGLYHYISNNFVSNKSDSPEERQGLLSDEERLEDEEHAELDSPLKMVNRLSEEPAIVERVSLNVLTTNDNCFFHSLSAYMLMNDIALPDELFKANDGYAKEICDMFPNQQAFTKYFEQLSERHQSDGQYMTERTLILGVLFRHYLSNTIIEKHQVNDMLESLKSQITGLKEILIENNSLIIQTLKDGEYGAFVSANEQTVRDFINNEKFEINAQECYENYKLEIAKPYVKLSPKDIEPMLHHLNIPTKVASYPANDAGLVEDIKLIVGDIEHHDNPLVLLLKNDHYYLNMPKTKQAMAFSKDLDFYKMERERILKYGTEHARVEQAQGSKAIFVQSIMPRDDNAPDKELQALISDIKRHTQQPEAIEEYSIELDLQAQRVMDSQLQALTINEQSELFSQQKMNYQSNLEDLLSKQSLFKDINVQMDLDKIDEAEALSNESDEDFSMRLQKAELQIAGLSM